MISGENRRTSQAKGGLRGGGETQKNPQEDLITFIQKQSQGKKKKSTDLPEKLDKQKKWGKMSYIL